ncbi:MAG: hypothetical protein QGD89_10050, partial [Actinomycetota bacterium]|nr:hypothetical protein [Actinomycetota bacterium]
TTEQTDEGGGISWPGILIGGGLIGVLGGALLALTGKKNCDREREALASAQRQLSAISETLEGAVDDFEDQESEISDLEAELESYNQAKQRGSSVDGDVRYYAHGGDRIPESELAIQVEYYEAMLENAREARAQDEARITEWQAKFDKAEQKVREAEEALAECEGAGTTDAAPPPSQPTGPGTPGPSGPRGPAISIPPLATDPSQPACEDGATYTETGEPETLRVIVDFAVIVTVVEGSERRVGEAAVMTLGLAELAADLDVIGSALGAKGAGQSIAGGIGGMASGTYVMGAGGLARGAAEGAMASGLTDVSIPTSAPEAVVEVLEGVANLGALVSKKVGEWLVANQLYEVRLTLFQQTITATPYDLSTCIGGEWECRRVWQYDVGPLTKRGRSNSKTFRLASDIARHRMQSEISRMGRRAQSAIAASVEARSDFDTRHQPGSCE